MFRHLADVTMHPGWANPKAAMRMEQIAGDGPGPDSAYRSSGVFVGNPVTADISVTAYEPSRRSRSVLISIRKASGTSGT